MTFVIWLIIVAVLWIVIYVRDRQRSAAVRAFAVRCDFHYLGDGVPKSLTLNDTQLERATSISNVVEGDQGGKRFIAFDCRIGSGRYSWSRTVIAVEARADVLSATFFNPKFAVDQSGDWALFYLPKKPFWPGGLMSVEELESYLKALAS